MTNTIARSFARYIALPVVSAGIIGGAALGLAGMANATTTVTQNGPNASIVTSPDTLPSPRRTHARVAPPPRCRPPRDVQPVSAQPNGATLQ